MVCGTILENAVVPEVRRSNATSWAYSGPRSRRRYGSSARTSKTPTGATGAAIIRTMPTPCRSNASRCRRIAASSASTSAGMISARNASISAGGRLGSNGAQIPRDIAATMAVSSSGPFAAATAITELSAGSHSARAAPRRSRCAASCRYVHVVRAVATSAGASARDSAWALTDASRKRCERLALLVVVITRWRASFFGEERDPRRGFRSAPRAARIDNHLPFAIRFGCFAVSVLGFGAHSRVVASAAESAPPIPWPRLSDRRCATRWA